jgi:hypothetical protein
VGLVGLGTEEIDTARVELRAERGQVVVLELVLDSECLQSGFVDDAAILGIVEEGLDRGKKSRRAQVRSLLRSGVMGAHRPGVAPPRDLKRFVAWGYSPA